MKNARRAQVLLWLTVFALIAPVQLAAQEAETSVSAPPAKANLYEGAPPETPHFTFTKKWVRAGANTRIRSILQRIKRHARYPDIARASGAEGTSTISFWILPNGRPRDLGIRKTSGNAFLDRASLEAVRKAAPLPYFNKTLVLTIRYNLPGASK